MERTVTDVRITVADQIFYRLSVTTFVESPSAEGRFFNSFRVSRASMPEIGLTPQNGQSHVSTTLRELVIKFGEDMAEGKSLVTDCKFGVCYKNAFWRDPRTLVLRVVPKLSPHHKYEIVVGGNKPFVSRTGVVITPFHWSFETN